MNTDVARAQKRRARWLRLGSITAAVSVVATLVGTVLPTTATPAFAVTGSDFQAGNIISDVVMYNTSTMTAASIQAFLNAKEPTCNAGFTCLKDYHQTTTNYAVPTTGGYVQNVCAPYVGASNESAATIIYKVAQYCGVNPQVILVTLQKEESLITSPAPSSGRYRSAMGYGCPDTAACNSDFYGFFKQVYWGARAMQRPASNYKPNVAKAIHYSPNSKCGTKTVTILNKATANLYTYTPYTPNSKALANLSGTGDSCSSYGNRNFWVYFNNWFGSTVIPQIDIQYVQASFQDILGRPATTTDEYTQGRYLIAHSKRSTFASRILTTTEYRTTLVNTLYTDILGAAPSAATLAGTLKALANGHIAQDDMVPRLLSSTQYYLNQGNTPTGYVDGVYQYSLGRAPTDVELAAALKSVPKIGRIAFARSIWHGTESNTIQANAIYETYLLRVPTPAELAAQVAFMKTHTLVDSKARIIGIAEYLYAAEVRYPVASS